MAQAVSPETVMAIAVLQAQGAGKPLEIEDISQFFVTLEDKGFDIGDVALRRAPHGVYSEDVEAFIGGLLEARYAIQRSPIKFLDEGILLCKEIVMEEFQRNPDNLKHVAQALGFDVSWVTTQVRA